MKIIFTGHYLMYDVSFKSGSGQTNWIVFCWSVRHSKSHSASKSSTTQRHCPILVSQPVKLKQFKIQVILEATTNSNWIML